jgi:hypothetical protein
MHTEHSAAKSTLKLSRKHTEPMIFAHFPFFERPAENGTSADSRRSTPGSARRASTSDALSESADSRRGSEPISAFQRKQYDYFMNLMDSESGLLLHVSAAARKR